MCLLRNSIRNQTNYSRDVEDAVPYKGECIFAFNGAKFRQFILPQAGGETPPLR